MKHIKIIKNEKEYLVLDRLGYFLYILDRILGLRKFNFYFNQTRKRFIVKIFLILLMIISMVILRYYSSITK